MTVAVVEPTEARPEAARGVRVDVDHASRRIAGREPKLVLDDVSLTITPGELVAIVGPSGAGKTSLLEVVAGIAPPTSGAVRFDGVDLHSHRAAFRGVLGFVPQDDIIHADLPV